MDKILKLSLNKLKARYENEEITESEFIKNRELLLGGADCSLSTIEKVTTGKVLRTLPLSRVKQALPNGSELSVDIVRDRTRVRKNNRTVATFSEAETYALINLLIRATSEGERK